MAKAVEIYSSGRAKQFKWTLTSDDFVADPTPDVLNHQDRTVQMFGATDTSGWNTATVAMHGASDPSVGYAAVNDLQGNPLAFTNQNKIEAVLESVRQYKPVVTVGALGANGVVVVLTCVGPY